jgi:uncharacterized protein
MHFARVLRAAGLPVGSDRLHAALSALQVAGLASRTDFHAVLAACLVDRREHQALFDQAFVLFWRDPDVEGRMRAMLMPKVDAQAPPPAIRENRRLADALFPPPPGAAPEAPPPEQLELDATLTFNQRELLRKADFDTMTAVEWRAALRLVSHLPLAFPPQRSRRMRAAHKPGRADVRASLRAMARQGGELAALRWRAPRTQPMPVLVLADISGSMSRYSRTLLHFAHLLAQHQSRVECFVFGTRLTRITRWLRSQDPDLAVAQVVAAVADWSGGTRITQCLREFNLHWARRVLPGSATVLLISDGLEQGDSAALAQEMARLHRRCQRLVWLNPLLRYSAFEPRAGGIRAMLPHVDHFVPAHNVESLQQLVELLGVPGS